MIQAVIFDMDGLMFDTEVMFKHQFRYELNKDNIQCPDSVVDAMIGCDSREVARFENEYPGISKTMERCQVTRADFFDTYFTEPGQANKPGLEELMSYLDQKDIPYAVASSSHKEHILKFMNFSGFEMHPKLVISGKEGFASKPDPAIFLEASKRLEVKPEHCLVLEDSKHGITAAYRAGMKSIFIPDQIQPDEEMKQYIQETKKNLHEVIEYLEINCK